MGNKTCKRCGYVWQPRVKLPKRCPGCKSQYWMTARTRATREEIKGKA